MKWEPIETAPKDESILLYYPTDDIIIVGYWCDFKWQIDHVGGYEWESDVDCIEPTHWMPLPEAP